MNKIKLRKESKALCPKCKSPDYEYIGLSEFNKHEFKCKSCGRYWQYGKTNSKYTQEQFERDLKDELVKMGYINK